MSSSETGDPAGRRKHGCSDKKGATVAENEDGESTDSDHLKVPSQYSHSVYDAKQQRGYG